MNRMAKLMDYHTANDFHRRHGDSPGKIQGVFSCAGTVPGLGAVDTDSGRSKAVSDAQLWNKPRQMPLQTVPVKFLYGGSRGGNRG